jgi:hypothetical protein
LAFAQLPPNDLRSNLTIRNPRRKKIKEKGDLKATKTVPRWINPTLFHRRLLISYQSKPRQVKDKESWCLARPGLIDIEFPCSHLPMGRN